MDKSFAAIIGIVLVLMFILGFKASYSTGIQPGYFEKAEAPAYGVGGGTKVEGLSQETQEYFKKLYEGEEEEE